ncbi:hypothetical protein MKW94_012698 [Papaver nudicaule]|uniref:Uncharacterized protein n=1 Tax=Papaver nudicaule TaxID=74823 RepID=A0AA41VUC9_PAPNU|nr:hypothetical protein [Papaver nudicaule]
MAISALLRAVTRPTQLSTCISSYESVSRNVNNPIIPWVGSVLGNTLSTSSRAFCSKPNQNDLAAHNETKRLSVSNPTKIIFKYSDEPRENSEYFKIRKIVEILSGDALFQLSEGGDKYYSLRIFLTSVLENYVNAAKSFSGRRISMLIVVTPPLFKKHLESMLKKAGAFVGLNVGTLIADEETEDSIPVGIKSESKYIKVSNNLCNFVSTRIREIMTSRDRIVIDSGTGCIKLTLDLNDFFDIRIWEIITNGDKTVLEIIVGELKKNRLDFTEDPMALQKLEQAVERAIARKSNAVKLNLPVPAGHPELSTTFSWGTSDHFYARSSITDDCYSCYPQ